QIRGKFDLVVSNILSKVLIALAPDLKRRVAAHGTLVLGGILAREARAVAAHYCEFDLASKRIDRGWATMVFER
ncbi:MAG TPA: 50S ribosomal protein L11 methyltransferase, partial [Candidatus Binataceae bacterium]|nr:50S ribosomal protein L11 methyltransferase [Candidatus Binataceae bacterium]